MGAALIPALVAPLLSDVVGSIIDPAPKQTIIAPAPVSPSLTSDQATQIAQEAQTKGQQFGQGLLTSILNRAKSQGLNQGELSAVSSKYNTWFAQNQDQINQSMALLAAHAQAQANYQNTVQQNNTDAKVAAANATGGGNAGFAKLATGLIGGLFGGGSGGGSGGGGSLLTGPDQSDFLA